MIFKRPPDFIIGPDKNKPYMRRWYVIPKNRFFNIYLHQFLCDDEDRALHDHPWWSMSIILKGGYKEWFFKDPELAATGEHPFDNLWFKFRKPGMIRWRNAKVAHRIELLTDYEKVSKVFKLHGS